MNAPVIIEGFEPMRADLATDAYYMAHPADDAMHWISSILRYNSPWLVWC